MAISAELAATILTVLNSGYITLGSLSMWANLLVGACCLRTKQLRKNKLNVMLAALCFTDAFYGASYCAAGCTRLLGIYNVTQQVTSFTQLQCAGVAYPLIIAFPLQRLMTMAVAFERLYAIAAPLSYRCHAGFFGYGCIASVIAIALVTSTVNFATASPTLILTTCNTVNAMSASGYREFYATAVQVVPCISTIVLYFVVFLYVHFRAMKTKRLVRNASHADRSRLAQMNKQIRLTRMVLWLVVIYTCTTGVYVLLNVVSPIVTTDTNLQSILLEIGGNLTVFNSLLNAAIPLKVVEVRKSALVLLGLRNTNSPNVALIEEAGGQLGTSIIPPGRLIVVAESHV